VLLLGQTRRLTQPQLQQGCEIRHGDRQVLIKFLRRFLVGCIGHRTDFERTNAVEAGRAGRATAWARGAVTTSSSPLAITSKTTRKSLTPHAERRSPAIDRAWPAKREGTRREQQAIIVLDRLGSNHDVADRQLRRETAGGTSTDYDFD
jgi:hypothetical protein